MNQVLRHPTFLLFSFCLLLTVLTLFIYGPGGDDDTHISYTVALQLAETGEIANHSGNPVEQGSSLLHVTTLAASYKLIHRLWPSVKLADIGPLFSLLAAVLCFPLLLNLARKCAITQHAYLLLCTTLSVSFSYWSLGGLESTLAALCFLCLVVSISNAYLSEQTSGITYLWSVYLSCLIVITVRPEGFFIITAFLLALQVLIWLNKTHNPGQDKYFCLKILCASLLLFSILCLWRESYFGQWFPQPVYAKAEGVSVDKILYGFLYFVYSMQLSIVLYTVALLFFLYLMFFKSRQFEFSFLVTISLCCSYLAFVVVSGGDWMTGGRFFTPIIPLLTLIILKALETFSFKRLYWFGLIFILMLETVFFALKFSTGENILLANDRGFVGKTAKFDRSVIKDNERYSWSENHNLIHLRDMSTINQLIDIINAVKDQPTFKNKAIEVSSIQMGMIPYHLSLTFGSSIQLIDLRGLSSYHITQCRYFDNATRNWLGIKSSYEKYFTAIESGQCPDLLLPDIIYDLSNLAPENIEKRFKSIRARGYRIVYRQIGILQDRAGYRSFDAAMFIAVSNEIYQQLPQDLRAKELHF